MEIHRLSNRWSGFRLVYMATVTDLSLNDSLCDQTRKQNFDKGILRVKHISPVRVDMIRQVFNDGSPAQRTFKRHFLLALWTKKTALSAPTQSVPRLPALPSPVFPYEIDIRAATDCTPSDIDRATRLINTTSY